MNKPTIQYPRGSGGSWLSNLIWRLEHNHLTLPTVDVVFDHETQSSSFCLSHKFSLFDGVNPVFDAAADNPRLIQFSSPVWFNQYINDAVKIKYHMAGLAKESILDQFYKLTDSAVYILTDALWQKTWGQPGQLEYRSLVEHSDQFVNSLFSVLDTFDIKYTADQLYCRNSIAYYKSTCPDPWDHLNNFDSLLWLAWCHAHVLINQQCLPATLNADATVYHIRSVVEPVSSAVLEITLPMTTKQQ